MVRARLAEIFKLKQEKARATNNYRREDDPSIGLWTRCESCGVVSYNKHLRGFFGICPNCSKQLQVKSIDRIAMLVDEDSWVPFYESLTPTDPLRFEDEKTYPERVLADQKYLRLEEGVQVGFSVLKGFPIALGVMEFDFMAGTMGSVVGEKIARLIEYASYHGLPLIIICASGGARMQEGSLSLMQMAKISAALRIYQSCAKLLYIPLLTSPTTGGVTASFGMLGDIILAEPNAVIGFAGRRVIEETLNEILPPDFQTAEYMWQHGLIDQVVERKFHREAFAEIFSLHYETPFTQKGVIPFALYQSLGHPFLDKSFAESPLYLPLVSLSNSLERTGPGTVANAAVKAINKQDFETSEKESTENSSSMLKIESNDPMVIALNLVARKEFMPKRKMNLEFLKFLNKDPVNLSSGNQSPLPEQINKNLLEGTSLVDQLREWDKQFIEDAYNFEPKDGFTTNSPDSVLEDFEDSNDLNPE